MFIYYLFENKEEDYHEKIYSSVVKNSKIPTILAKYDYTLRDMYKCGYITLKEVHHFLNNLIVAEGKMYL
ncbi:hypothetical protein BFG57_15095 [Bacillus solimangrovi]|uniref:Uncharacterized protein n=1 Tax=Bacillus solimangrovi TaxID=1305675 RepID=A0A1E5LEX4_9BACI|nr:hypothetical protein BFG57_15095 [Bacillus solimangrovi]